MKRVRCLLVLNLITISLYAQKVKLAEGTPVKVKIVAELSSKTAQVGDILSFTVVENIKVGGKILIDSNSNATGEVIEAQKARSLGRPGKLDFTINFTKAIDDQIIKVRATEKKLSGTNRTGGVIAAAVIFAPVAIFIKGKDVVIEKDKEFLVFIDKDYEIEIK